MKEEALCPILFHDVIYKKFTRCPENKIICCKICEVDCCENICCGSRKFLEREKCDLFSYKFTYKELFLVVITSPKFKWGFPFSNECVKFRKKVNAKKC